ncbi:serine/threonine-protein phosphatase [Dactylosporangium vinaceum]|uniref:PP2C family protein-serine/threonine phosphatase n=1 Tax=Dactylosporangium vinaceum TaxID=53362 RepID=A0ABV5MD18_9ACTN|nr:PP2C family protein-serine/threonine phosphatase [Dactylosporangium vinaceum]UAC00803.1 serine/threonine-protein phosphatase [Dactylosporangium vinaceum]
MIDPFAAAGPLRAQYLGVDWAAGPLGPVSGWSPALLGAADLILHSRNPATLLWGPQFVMLYNAAYVPMIGDKHPAALGAPARQVFGEIWADIGPMLESVRAGRGSTWAEDMRLLMTRHGYPEETYFTFSYSPVRGPDGVIEGVLDIASETTGQVVDRRRLALLARLTDEIADVKTGDEFVERALAALRSDPADLPDVRITDTGPDPDDVQLVTGLSPHLRDDEEYRGFRRLVTAALVHGRARLAERRLAATERQMAEALQRSLLSRPASVDHLQIAVRYRPVAVGAQVGGDWYDAFRLPGDILAVVVGDVTGHDRDAAAAMSQIRNLLRGIAYALPQAPDRILAALDDAMAGLSVDTLATVVLACVDPSTHLMTWSNAGHMPPVLLDAAGPRLLQARSEMLLGSRLPVQRSSHETYLEPGATVVFYTDGLVERRDRGIDAGLDLLLEALLGRQDLTAEQLCDLLSERFGDNTEDDIVLAVIRRAG